MTTWIIHNKKVHASEAEQVRRHSSSQSGEHIESQLLESDGKISSVQFHQKYTLYEYQKCNKKYGLFHKEPSTGHQRSYVVIADLALQDDEARLQFNEKVKNTNLHKHQFNLANPEQIKHIRMNKADAMCLATILNQLTPFSHEVTEVLVKFLCKSAIEDAFAFRESIYSGTTLQKIIDICNPSDTKELDKEFPIRSKYRR